MRCLLLLLAVLSAANAQELELQKGDRIVFVGNTFAERMQLFGWFETFLHTRFPDHDLTVRNMGWSADEIGARPRPLGFGSRQRYLAEEGADVVIACFGMNESYAGEQGLQPFRGALDAWIRELLSRPYNERSPPRLVLVSPIAHESLGGMLPDGDAHNGVLERYSRVMAETARAHSVPFVDLFHPTLKHAGKPLTSNGIHLTRYGYWRVSQIMARALGLIDGVPPPDAATPLASAEALRRAVHDKNDTWQLLWHGPNMEYVHGRRNRLGGAKRMPAERVQLRDLLRQMDARIRSMPKPPPGSIWRSEPGGKPHWITPPGYEELDLPAVVFEDDVPGTILDPAAALKSFTLPDGYEINLFASELDAPVYNPVAMSWDAHGRLWVATSPTWPHPIPGQAPNDAIIILQDIDRDGVADKHTVFMDGLDMVHGLALGDGGAYISQTPNLIFARDTDDDLVADSFEVKLHGFGGEDVEHSINNYRWGPDGALYFMEGIFFHTQVETPLGPRRLLDGGVFRYKPSTARFDVFASYAFWNPWGQVFDAWGRQLVLDASSHDYFNASVLASPFVYPKHKQNRHGALSFAPGGLGPAAGIEIIRSHQFPDEAQGRFMANQLSGGFRGTRWFDIQDRGSSYAVTQVDPPLLVSSDPHFRPIAMNFGPDGALYLVDFYSPLIENTSEPKRALGRDHMHGRIWRIRHKGRPLRPQPQIASESVPTLIELLQDAEERTRELARRELHERGAEAVLPHVNTWTSQLDRTKADHERHLLEALWLHQAFEDVNSALLSTLLDAKDPRARAAATRVLRFWQDRIDNSLSLLEALVEDDDAKVRLQALLACGFDGSPRARAVMLRVTRHAMDDGLRHALDDTTQAFDRRGVAATLPGFPEGDAYVLRRIPSSRLVTMKRGASVCREIATRSGLDASLRRDALATSAQRKGTTFIAELLDALATTSREGTTRQDVRADLIQLLMARPRPELRRAMESLSALASGAKHADSRAAGYAAMVVARGAEEGWAFAARTDGVTHLLEGVRVIREPTTRAQLTGQINSLLAPETAPPLRRAAILALSSLSGVDDTVFATLASLLRDRDDVDTAITALARVPSAFWPRDRIAAVATDVTAHVANVEPEDRGRPTFKRALRLANELVSLLDPVAAKPLQDRLGSLGVRGLTVRAVPHLMLFDKTHLVVEVGEPVELTFENPGVMGHNLVIVKPRALEEIGGRADAMVGDVAGDPAHRFVPDSDKVLHHSGMVKPREAVTLSFVAPTTAGAYPYLCTVPGHWVRMNGTLHVVADVAQWVRENPEKAFGSNPLARVQPRDWKLDDLTGDLSSLASGRDGDRGKRLFATHCSPCHRLEEAGFVVGPDLIEVSARLSPAEMLAEMLMPSKKIDDAYRSWIITTRDEEVAYGVIVERTDDWIRVVENPRLDKVGVKLPRDQIAEMRPSGTSTMPMGVLNPLSRDQILDLLAYVRSVGK
ncbi:MAG: hypothetical protein CMJ90_00835 [Planctomycetes bacterium]|nr:hypothetical protein [Planctomycetota bacterium]